MLGGAQLQKKAFHLQDKDTGSGPWLHFLKGGRSEFQGSMVL